MTVGGTSLRLRREVLQNEHKQHMTLKYESYIRLQNITSGDSTIVGKNNSLWYLWLSSEYVCAESWYRNETIAILLVYNDVMQLDLHP